MPTWKSFAAAAKEFDRLKRDLSPTEMRRVSKAMAEEGEHIAALFARGAVGGDKKHSGWGVPLDTRTRPVRGTAFVMSPTKRSAGPWTEIEDGRHAGGGVGLFQGPGVNLRTGNTRRRKDGTISTRRRSAAATRRAASRWNGSTPARGAASGAVARMERDIPKIAEREIRRIMRKRVDLN